MLFTKHLSVMVKSGITISESLDVLISQTKSVPFKKILSDLLYDTKNGQSLTKALNKHPHVFNPLYVSLIEVGEQSGTLEKSMEYLSQQLAKDYIFRKKVQNTMLYPSLVFIVALIVGGGVGLFVLPKLTELFSSFDFELPISTKILVFVANMMKDYGVFIIGGIFALLLFLKFLVNTTPVKPSWHRILLSLPIFGNFLASVEMANFCRNLGIMLKSGLPITAALKIQNQTAENLVFKDYIDRIEKAIIKGKKISDELSEKKFTYFPVIATKMIAVGEKTGKLDESLIYLGEFFEEEVDDTTKNLTTVLEPILLLFIALLVAFVAMAIISPIYQFTGSIKK